MYDLNKIHKDHLPAFKDVLATRAWSGMSEEQIQHIYDLYVELNKHPKKDWEDVAKNFSEERRP